MVPQMLNHLSTHSERAAEQREQQSEELYTQAVEQMQKAIQSHFENKEALQTSTRLFYKMISYDEADFRPFLFLGYILFLTGDLQESELYLQRALELNPHEPDTHSLLALIDQQKKVLSFRAYDPDMPIEVQQINPAQLYQEVENHIQTQLKKLMIRENPALKPVLEKSALSELRTLVLAQADFMQMLETPLQILKSHLDAQSFENMLRPLLTRQQHIQECCDLSEQLVKHKHKINLKIKDLLSFQQAVKKLCKHEQAVTLNQELETYYTVCDHLADQLDLLEQQGHQVDALVQSYERLVKQVTLAQEAFEQRCQQQRLQLVLA